MLPLAVSTFYHCKLETRLIGCQHQLLQDKHPPEQQNLKVVGAKPFSNVGLNWSQLLPLFSEGVEPQMPACLEHWLNDIRRPRRLKGARARGGNRGHAARLPRRFRHSRRIEAWLKVRERKKGRARRGFTDFFYGFRKQR